MIDLRLYDNFMSYVPLEFSRKIYEKLVNYWVKWIKTSQECSFGEPSQNVVTKFNMIQREPNLPIVLLLMVLVLNNIFGFHFIQKFNQDKTLLLCQLKIFSEATHGMNMLDGHWQVLQMEEA